MIRIRWSEAEINVFRYWRFHHPDPRVQVRLEALYLRSQGVATGDIPRLCGISKASFHRYLNAYVAGGSNSCNASSIICVHLSCRLFMAMTYVAAVGCITRRGWRFQPRS